MPPPELAQQTDEQLACQVQAGCVDSFDELDRRLRPRLLLVLNRRMQNRLDAEDLVQQTLLRVYEKIHLYDSQQKLSPWVFTIALRLAASHGRKRSVGTIQENMLLAEVDDRSPPPEKAAIAAEERDEIWAIADRVLKPDQWTALWLFYGEGHSIGEVAQSMERTRATVSVLLFRARQGLMPHLSTIAEVDERPVAKEATKQRLGLAKKSTPLVSGCKT